MHNQIEVVFVAESSEGQKYRWIETDSNICFKKHKVDVTVL